MEPATKKLLDPTFKLPEELQHAIYRDWGIFYHKHRTYHRALSCFRHAFLLNSTNYIPLEKCSRCNYELCNIDQAVKDIRQAIKTNQNPIIDLTLYHHYIDCLLDQNHIEKSIIEAYQTLFKNDSHLNQTKCHDRLDYLEAIIESTIGPISGESLLSQRNIIRKLESKRTVKTSEKRDICGALSGIYITEKHIPLKDRQHAVTSSILNSTYLATTAHDFEFIIKLKNSNVLNLEQTTESTQVYRDIVNETLSDVLNWRNMLRIRAPLYTKRKPKEFAESILYHVQFQTRRDTFKQLERIRKLMINGDVDQIEHDVRHILHNYYSIKTNRVFPRKFEFSNDLCNMVGLTHLHKLTIPIDLMTCPPYDRINRLFQLKTLSDTDEAYESQKNFTPVFGERIATVTHTSDKSFIATKRKLEMLITLDQLVKFPVEHCFVYYEMCELDLLLQKVDEELIQAKKIVLKAKQCKNAIWSFLGYYMIARAEQLRRAYPNVQNALGRMRSVARLLDEHVQHFVDVAIELNELDIERRRVEELAKEEEKANDEKMRKLKKEWLLKQSIMMPRAQFKAKFGDFERATRSSQIAHEMAEKLVGVE